MSRVYGADENGKRLLIRIECDEPGCAASIKPNPEIASSGWVKGGTYDEARRESVGEWDYCPEHAP